MKAASREAIDGSSSGYPMLIFNVLCVIGLVGSLGYPIWDTVFSGYLTPGKLAGTYVFESNGNREEIRLDGDMRFVQRLRVDGQELRAEGVYEISGASIVFRSLNGTVAASGPAAGLPQKVAMRVAAWEDGGSLCFERAAAIAAGSVNQPGRPPSPPSESGTQRRTPGTQAFRDRRMDWATLSLTAGR